MRNAAALIVVALTVSGCVTAILTDQGGRVRITSNPDVVKGCAFVGSVKGQDRMNGGIVGQSAAEENAMRRLQNAAAEVQADTVMIATSSTGFSGSVIRGEAYHCGAPGRVAAGQ